MNVGELKELLEDLPDDLPVTVAHQPTYPLAAEISTVSLEVEEIDDEDILEESKEPNERPVRVWIATEGSTDYAPSKAWNGGEFKRG